MTFFHTRLTALNHDPITVWVNDEQTKIPIIDGKITFTDESTGASFSLYVTQVKGLGTADADNLTELGDNHKIIIKCLLDAYPKEDVWTTDDILLKIKYFLSLQLEEGQHLNFKPNNWRRPISELLRKGILKQWQRNNPPTYEINLHKAETAFNSGKFE